MWASESDCLSGNAGSVVSCTCSVDEPLAERTALGVVAREKMSVMWAAGDTLGQLEKSRCGYSRGVRIRCLTVVHGMRGQILLRL